MSSVAHCPPFPSLALDTLSVTRDALHAYARVLGGWTSSSRARRKHWWHASLRNSLNGVTTGVIFVEKTQFEIELSFAHSLLLVRTAAGESLSVELCGQPASELSEQVNEFLRSAGVSEEAIGAANKTRADAHTPRFEGYSAAAASAMAGALSSVTSVMESFRAGIREETSPIQVWPHHFDLSMLWLPGDKIAGQDPGDEEHADKQINFGFVFGDDSLPEPYIYITAYPTPGAFSSLDLPKGAEWKSGGFTGVVLTYESLLNQVNPAEYLLTLCQQLLTAGQLYLINNMK